MDSVPPDETPREPTRDLASTDEILRMGAEPHARTRAASNHDKSQQSAADQERNGPICDLESKDDEDPKLPKVAKDPNSLVDLAGAGQDTRGAARG